MSFRDARRWTRLRPDSITECTVSLISGGRSRPAELVDLSPGGIAIELPESTRRSFEKDERVHLRVRFRGLSKVELPALILHARHRPGKPCRIGLAWLQTPPDWDETDRREFPRLVTPPEDGFAIRIRNEHLLGLWTRAAILDLSSDRGMRVEGVGGPIWMLPGMEIGIHLDLPVLHETPLPCQVLWVRGDTTGKVQAGLRILDLEAPGLDALDQWIAMYGHWSPRELVSRGFRSPSIPGQYRIRSTEAKFELNRLHAHLVDCSTRPTRIGFESLPLPEEHLSRHSYIGCWDGERLVATLCLDTPPEGEPDDDAIRLGAAGFEVDWFDTEILLGLWHQALRVFLASGRNRLILWCPSGRERLFGQLGMSPLDGATAPRGGWYVLRLDTALIGAGISPVAWAWLYGEVGSYRARQGGLHLGAKKCLKRWLRMGLNLALSDILLPGKRKRIADEIALWCSEATRN